MTELNRRLTLIIFAALLLISAHSADSKEIESKTKAIRNQKQRILERIDSFGGIEGISMSLKQFHEKVREHIEAHKGHRSEMKVGSVIFNSEICKAAIMDRWSNPHVKTGKGHDPLTSIIDFGRELKEINVDLIVVPVPSKIEAYPEEFGVSIEEGIPVSIARNRFMLALLDAGIEVVDVLPEIQCHKSNADFPLYETAYHHHSGLGAIHAGDAVAARLKRYTSSMADTSRFSMREVNTHERHHPDVPMKAWEVLYDGRPYRHVDNSPVVVIGDSNCFAHGRASWTSHIARSLGLPVTEVARPGGGPYAHVRLAELGKANLKQRKVVVWLMTSSHIQRHQWGRADLIESATLMGLLSSGRVDEAAAEYQALKAVGKISEMGESEANTFGYRYLEAGDIERALKVFWLVVKAYPNSFNAHDSLGEAYQRIGAKEEARKSYLESYRLNPLRSAAKERLESLGLPYTLPELYQLPRERLAAYVGNFRWNRVIFEISQSEDGLLVQQRGRPRGNFEIIPVAEDTFVDEGGIRIRFHRNDKNEIIGMTAFAGNTLEFVKITGAESDENDR